MYAEIWVAISSFLNRNVFLYQFKFNQTFLGCLGYLNNMFLKNSFYIKWMKIFFHIQIFTRPYSLMKLFGNV